MLTISLDEYGAFEQIGNANGPVFIAGIIYDDKGNKGETDKERNRIKAYYRNAVEEAKSENTSVYSEDFSYPQALHSNGDKDRDHYVVSAVKEKIRNSLPEFLQDGTYNTKKVLENSSRKGKYHLFVMVKSRYGIEQLMGDKINILARDDFASNLYYHMSSKLITRLLFHNPVISEINDVALNLATRASQSYSRKSDLRNYEKQDYIVQRGINNRYFVQITNADSYRALIAEEMIRANKTDMKISDFKVRPIKYEPDKENMEFLYLADSICSVIGYTFNKQTDISIETISKKIDQMNGLSDNLVFGYDRIDVLFSEAWKKIEEEDYYSALSLLFEMGQDEGAFARYYCEHWKTAAEERIRNGNSNNNNISAFSIAIQKLKSTLSTNTLNQDKCLYILKILEFIGKRLEEKHHVYIMSQTMYDLYDTGVSAYTHIGDSKTAEQYYKCCKQYEKMVDLSRILTTKNRMVVFHCDYLDFNKALSISDENVMYQELLYELRKEVDPENDAAVYSIEYGKAVSQRAQVYAFLRDQRAEEDFNTALEKMPVGSADYKITQSYLLHYYLDNRIKDKYLKQAASYFGNSYNISDQLKYIIAEGTKENPLINAKYALYVYVRGLYTFQSEKIDDQIWKQLNDFEKDFGEARGGSSWRLSGHPTELIYKYMNLIHIRRFRRANNRYEKNMLGMPENSGAIVEAIKKFSEIECAGAKGNNKKRNELSIRLCQYLKMNFDVFYEKIFPESGEECYIELDRLFTFMYR